MHLLRVCLILSLFFCASLLSASEELVPPGGTGTIDLLMERAIDRQLIAGGVVVVGNHDGILYSTAKGPLSPSPGAPPLTDRTIFDLASLTKVIATTPAIMKLLDEGRISLLDPVDKWIPEFSGNGCEQITILNLLTHTSGLNDFDVPSSNAMGGAILKAAAARHRARPGTSFNYADINFILLGEIVHRVSEKTLDVFCHDEIYAPMDANSTMFLPPQIMSENIAPTLGFRGGVVQDMNARRLGSVAGHAGLFSSAQDLARFARLVLGGGVIDGKRILSERVVTQMTAPYFYSNGSVVRGLGWDMESPFSAPKGSLFSEVSFGHTGYSGSSIWIDPQRDLFVVLLTNRLNYRDVKSFNNLRRDISTIAAADFARTADLQRLSQPLEVARITAELLRPSWSAVQAAPKRKVHVVHREPARKMKIAYVSTDSKSRQYEGKKRGKGHRRVQGKPRRA
jgi:CubicO group peptidase (beta-lactamase class C family)